MIKSKPKPGDAGQAPEPVPGVDVGDHLYVHHQGSPCTGRVIAHGAHGVTVAIGGVHHKVRWDKVLGHKRRAPQNYNVVDQGEDGMIVADARGLRRYIATPNEAKEDPMVAKSLPLLLLRKAMPAPGLQQKKLTDKRGVQTTRWVRVDQGMHPAQRGQHVGFENGEHKGHGEVVASGQHGVTVRDGAGGEHRIHHEKVTHHWSGDEAPTMSPHAQEAADAAKEAANASPEAKAAALFHPDEVKALPKRAAQPHKTWEDLAKHAPAALEEFRGILGKIGQTMSLRTDKKPDDVAPEHWDNSDGFLFVGGLKGEKRAREKAEADYGGDYSRLCDVVRGTIAVATLDEAAQALEHVKASGLKIAQQPKNRLATPTDTGYRDLLMVVQLPSGMMAELQINLKAMQAAKSGPGHKEYEVTRSLQAKHGEDEPTDHWPPEDHSEFYRALKAQKDVYGAAWAKATGAAAAAAPGGALVKAMDGQRTPSLIKFRKPAIMVIWKRS